MTTFVLVLLAHVYAGDSVTVVQGFYTSRETCEAAGTAYRTTKDVLDRDLNFKCIPGPEIRR